MSPKNQAEADKNSPPIIPAAAVLICKASPEGREVFMVVGQHKIDFASGALVFPGGKLDEEDWSPDYRAHCEAADSMTDESLAYHIAAIRETFEECGVLLAREPKSSEIKSPDYISGDRLKTLEHYRVALNERHEGLLEMVKTENLILACENMLRFAHWVTPTGMPKRFDTHFFIARAPEDHLAQHDGSEAVDSVWINPSRLLAEADEGKWTIIFPTRCNIEMLAESATVDEAIEKSKARTIVRVEPRIDETPDGRLLRIPVEAGYPVSEAVFDF